MTRSAQSTSFPAACGEGRCSWPGRAASAVGECRSRARRSSKGQAVMTWILVTGMDLAYSSILPSKLAARGGNCSRSSPSGGPGRRHRPVPSVVMAPAPCGARAGEGRPGRAKAAARPLGGLRRSRRAQPSGAGLRMVLRDVCAGVRGRECWRKHSLVRPTPTPDVTPQQRLGYAGIGGLAVVSLQTPAHDHGPRRCREGVM